MRRPETRSPGVRSLAPRERRVRLDALDPRRDERLAPLMTAIERGEIAALSLDFFDTTCGRSVPRPIDAFPRVGERLVARGLLASAVPPASFLGVRRAAEERARLRRPGRTEVHLADIYAEIPAALLPAEHREAAAALELDVEAELAIVDPSVIAVAEYARSRRLPVAIASDTYLRGDELGALLRGAGCGFVPDLILTSSDAGVCKAAGLLRVLPTRLCVEAGRIAHLGDDPVADVRAATEAGLRAFPYPAGDEELRTVAARESALTLENAAADGGLTFLRRRALSRASSAGDVRAHFRLGASVFGPVFAGYAEWIVDELAARNAAGAVCFMREGAFLAELVEAAARARGARFHLAPLWISRAASFRAAIGALDAATVAAALERRLPPRVDELCRALGIEPSAAALPPATWSSKMDSVALTQSVARALLRPAARARVERAAREQRALLAAHVQEAAPESGPLVCVDLGWGATIQRHLVRALRLAGVQREVVGLYLAASPRAAAAMMEGSSVRGFLASPGEHDALAELVARSPEILEQLCTAHVGSVLGYRRDPSGHVTPVLGAPASDPAGAQERAAVRDGIRFFQAQHLALRRPGHGPLPVAELRRIVARFVARPLDAEAALVGGWWHDENFGSGVSLAIAPRLQPALLAGRTGVELYWDRTLPWPAGVAAQGHPTLADELAAYALVGAFGPGETPTRHAERAAARHVVVDELDAMARAFAPAIYRTCAWALSRWSTHNGAPPLRYRFADAVNDGLKRAAPAVHARAKAAAVDALGTRGGILWPASRWMAVRPMGASPRGRGGRRPGSRRGRAPH